jgi:hypothetical protein
MVEICNPGDFPLNSIPTTEIFINQTTVISSSLTSHCTDRKVCALNDSNRPKFNIRFLKTPPSVTVFLKILYTITSVTDQPRFNFTHICFVPYVFGRNTFV